MRVSLQAHWAEMHKNDQQEGRHERALEVRQKKKEESAARHEEQLRRNKEESARREKERTQWREERRRRSTGSDLGLGLGSALASRSVPNTELGTLGVGLNHNRAAVNHERPRRLRRGRPPRLLLARVPCASCRG